MQGGRLSTRGGGGQAGALAQTRRSRAIEQRGKRAARSQEHYQKAAAAAAAAAAALGRLMEAAAAAWRRRHGHGRHWPRQLQGMRGGQGGIPSPEARTVHLGQAQRPRLRGRSRSPPQLGGLAKCTRGEFNGHGLAGARAHERRAPKQRGTHISHEQSSAAALTRWLGRQPPGAAAPTRPLPTEPPRRQRDRRSPLQLRGR